MLRISRYPSPQQSDSKDWQKMPTNNLIRSLSVEGWPLSRALTVKHVRWEQGLWCSWHTRLGPSQTTLQENTFSSGVSWVGGISHRCTAKSFFSHFVVILLTKRLVAMLFAYRLLAGRQFIYFLPSSNMSLCRLQPLQGLISTIYLAIQCT